MAYANSRKCFRFGRRSHRAVFFVAVALVYFVLTPALFSPILPNSKYMSDEEICSSKLFSFSNLIRCRVILKERVLGLDTQESQKRKLDSLRNLPNNSTSREKTDGIIMNEFSIDVIHNIIVVASCRDDTSNIKSIKSWTMNNPGPRHILLIDWSSNIPYKDLLPNTLRNNKRVSIVRVESSEDTFQGSHSYNLGALIASDLPDVDDSTWLLKLTCDTFLFEDFFSLHPLEDKTFYHSEPSKKSATPQYTPPENGILFVKLADFLKIHGYDERIQSSTYYDAEIVKRLTNSGLTAQSIRPDSFTSLSAGTLEKKGTTSLDIYNPLLEYNIDKLLLENGIPQWNSSMQGCSFEVSNRVNWGEGQGATQSATLITSPSSIRNAISSPELEAFTRDSYGALLKNIWGLKFQENGYSVDYLKRLVSLNIKAAGKKHLVVRLKHGLAARLTTLASAWVVSRLTNRYLRVLWIPDQYCKASFSDLFETDTLETDGMDIWDEFNEPIDTNLYSTIDQLKNPDEIAEEAYRHVYFLPNTILDTNYVNKTEMAYFINKVLKPQQFVLDIIDSVDLPKKVERPIIDKPEIVDMKNSEIIGFKKEEEAEVNNPAPPSEIQQDLQAEEDIEEQPNDPVIKLPPLGEEKVKLHEEMEENVDSTKTRPVELKEAQKNEEDEIGKVLGREYKKTKESENNLNKADGEGEVFEKEQSDENDRSPVPKVDEIEGSVVRPSSTKEINIQRKESFKKAVLLENPQKEAEIKLSKNEVPKHVLETRSLSDTTKKIRDALKDKVNDNRSTDLSIKKAQKPSNGYIGVHIRNSNPFPELLNAQTGKSELLESDFTPIEWTNIQSSRIQTKIELFVKEMKVILADNPNQVFFVSTDNHKNIDVILDNFKSETKTISIQNKKFDGDIDTFIPPVSLKNIRYIDNRGCVSRNKKCLAFALADLLILGRSTGDFLGSGASSFTQTAALLCDIQPRIAGVSFPKAYFGDWVDL